MNRLEEQVKKLLKDIVDQYDGPECWKFDNLDHNLDLYNIKGKKREQIKQALNKLKGMGSKKLNMGRIQIDFTSAGDPEDIKLVKKIRQALTQDILDRYDNPDYWDESIIDDYLHGYSEEEREKIRNLIDEN